MINSIKSINPNAKDNIGETIKEVIDNNIWPLCENEFYKKELTIKRTNHILRNNNHPDIGMKKLTNDHAKFAAIILYKISPDEVKSQTIGENIQSKTVFRIDKFKRIRNELLGTFHVEGQTSWIKSYEALRDSLTEFITNNNSDDFAKSINSELIKL